MLWPRVQGESQLGTMLLAALTVESAAISNKQEVDQASLKWPEGSEPWPQNSQNYCLWLPRIVWIPSSTHSKVPALELPSFCLKQAPKVKGIEKKCGVAIVRLYIMLEKCSM